MERTFSPNYKKRKVLSFFTCLFLIITTLSGQNIPEDFLMSDSAMCNTMDNFEKLSIKDTIVDTLSIYTFQEVQEKPDFFGAPGDTIWERATNYIQSSISIPSDSLCHGLVVVEFVVERDGSVSLPFVKHTLHLKNCEGYKEEAIRVVNSFPKWIPGKINGITVRTLVKVPVRFE